MVIAFLIDGLLRLAFLAIVGLLVYRAWVKATPVQQARRKANKLAHREARARQAELLNPRP
jgi:uncharacterized protein YpmB